MGNYDLFWAMVDSNCILLTCLCCAHKPSLSTACIVGPALGSVVSIQDNMVCVERALP